MVPKSDGCSLFNQNGPANETVKISGTKRPQPQCLMNSPCLQTRIRRSGQHLLVYVHRKPDSERLKNRTCNQSKDLPITLCEQDEKNCEQSPMKYSTIQIPKAVPEPGTCADGVSSALPSLTFDSGKSKITSLVAESKCRQLDYPKRLNVQHWEERFFLLHNFLKVLDQSTQDD